MQFSCDSKSQIEIKGTCEQGVGSQTLSRASLIIMHLLSAGVCLSTGRKSESAASKCLQLANRYYMQSVKHTAVLRPCLQRWVSCLVGMSGKAVNTNSLISGSSLLEQKSSIPVNPSALSHSPHVGLLSALREKLNFAGYHGRDLELGPCPWEEEEGGERGVHPPSLLTK